MNTTRDAATFGHGFQPLWYRPWLRFLDGGDDGGAHEDGGDTNADGDGDANTVDGDGDGSNAHAGGDTGDQVDGEEALGDKGKKALDRMKAALREQKTRAAAAEAEAARLKAQIEGKADEHNQQVQQQQVRDQALAAANDRIKRAEIRTAAKGKLASAEDALIFIDLDDIDIDDEGNVDQEAVEAAIDELLTKKPYLAAQGGQRFQGGGDGGARNGGPGPRQLTQEDVEKMTPEQVDKARKAGQLNRLLGATR